MKLFGLSISKSKSRNIPKIKARGKYKIVDGRTQQNIEKSTADFRCEDEILDPLKRAKLLDLTRNLVRNSSLFNTILGQLTTNVVSTCGGKVILNYPNKLFDKTLKNNFFRYTRNVDFFTGDTFNHFLKRVLREYIIGGDVVLLFDNNLVEDSGKVLLFESGEIVNVSDEEVKRHYGKNSYCVNGKVYNSNGRHIGTIVSKSQSGLELADPDKCWFLKKDPNSTPLENAWLHFSSNWREGRGVSQAASAIATIHQLEDLVQSELLASRRNSQIFCWLTSNNTVDEQIPSAFDQSDLQDMTDEQVKEIVKEEAASTQVVSFNKAREQEIIYEALPDGISPQQLQTQHPNSNVEVMVDWLANRVAASMGLSKTFATGNPQDADWRANQLFSYPAILELQKNLEGVCDWVFFRFADYLADHGVIEYVDPHLMEYVDWSWKGIDTLDPVANENAIEKKLRNMTSTLKDELGNDWKEQLEQYKIEIDYCRENGLPHPAFNMISGGERHESFQDSQNDNAQGADK